MQRIERPEPVEPKGYWLDTEFIAENILATLRELLPRRMAKDDAEKFLKLCSQAAQQVKETAPATPTGKIVSQLTRVAARARALRVSMKQMSMDTRSVFNTHFDALAYLTKPPHRIAELSRALVRHDDPGRKFYSFRGDAFFQGTWDLVSDLEAGANYAASQCRPSRQSKTSQNNARHLVRLIAASYRGLTGRLPPRNAGTWFPGFMEEISSSLGFSCGPRLTRAVLLEMEGSPRAMPIDMDSPTRAASASLSQR